MLMNNFTLIKNKLERQMTDSGNVISEDLDAAKVIFKDKIREVRA